MSKLFGGLNILKWFRRNIYAILFVTLVECLSAVLAYYLSGNNLLVAAVFASIMGGIAFFLAILYKEVQERKYKDKRITIKGILKIARNLLLEFGLAEYLDGLIFRPFFLVVFPMFISPYLLGVLVGSLLVEIFYILVVLFSYKSRKRLLID